MGKPLNESLPEDSSPTSPIPSSPSQHEHDVDVHSERDHTHHIPTKKDQDIMKGYESRSHLTKFYSRKVRDI